jgi:transposase
MTQITARLPDDLVAGIDEAARSMNRSRAEVVRQAIEYYLDDLDDLRLALDRLRDPADPVLDWDEVKRDLLAQD